MGHGSLLPLGILVVIAACNAVPEKKAEPAPATPATNLQGWRSVADGRMGTDGIFYSDAGRFFVAFPGEPVHESKDVQAEVGKIRMEVFVHEESVTMAYMVAYSDYPTAFVDPIGWEKFLDRAVAGAIRSMGIESVEKSEAIMVNGFHGTSYRAKGKGPHLVSKMLLVKNRLYQITILSDGDYPTEAVATQFLNSFHMVLPGQPLEDWWPEELDSLSANLE